jgi:putative transposase
MVRPLRLEFSGALYHVMSRGNRREALYLDDTDFARFLTTLGEVCDRFNWVVHAYCLMSNHYHVLIETPDGNLSRGMRQLNGVYTQWFNRRHRKVGHLFQGRYKAILVQKEAYLLELSRYVVLNPVRAGMVAAPEEWFWSSYRAALGQEEAPDWLETDWLLAQFGRERRAARGAYVEFVAAGQSAANPLEDVRHQLFLGDDAFLARFQDAKAPPDLAEVSRAQRRSLAKPLAHYAQVHADRSRAMATAYLSGGYTMKDVAAHFGVHYMTVSRAVRRFEQGAVLECEN